jgi:hypothetical protein
VTLKGTASRYHLNYIFIKIEGDTAEGYHLFCIPNNKVGDITAFVISYGGGVTLKVITSFILFIK